jgi:hypothetical protein
MSDTGSRSTREYIIQVGCHLTRTRAGGFGGLDITLMPDGHTLIQGPIQDQSALFGILIRIRDMGIPLIAVTYVGQTGDESNHSFEKE